MIIDADKVAVDLEKEYTVAKTHPGPVFGFAHYGENWPLLNRATGGVIKHAFVVMAARQKVGKSFLACHLIVPIAQQAKQAGKVVRVVTLEMPSLDYQKRICAYVARVNVRRVNEGTLTPEEEERYIGAVRYVSSLPIQYLSNESPTQLEIDMFGSDAFSVNFAKINKFIEKDTYWWLIDNIGNIDDAGRDEKSRIDSIAMQLQRLSQSKVGGLAIAHLNRASMDGREPDMHGLAGSDLLTRLAYAVWTLWRPYFEYRGELPEEDKEFIMEKGWEPASLKIVMRNEGSERIYLAWSKHLAAFSELPDMTQMILPSVMR